MDQLENCIEITCSAYMEDEDAIKWFAGRDDWHDSICGVKSPLIGMDNLNFFSIEAIIKDCDAQRHNLKNRVDQPGVKPLHLPTDPEAFEVIQRVASYDYHVDYHTTANISAFDDRTRDLAEKGLLPKR